MSFIIIYDNKYNLYELVSKYDFCIIWGSGETLEECLKDGEVWELEELYDFSEI